MPIPRRKRAELKKVFREIMNNPNETSFMRLRAATRLQRLLEVEAAEDAAKKVLNDLNDSSEKKEKDPFNLG